MLQAVEHPVREVRIQPQGLKGILGRPIIAKGIVIFAHGSGSGRLSPRNNHVAAALRQAGLATFLLDLLTPEEEHDRRNVFNIDLLASRLTLASEWIADRAETSGACTAWSTEWLKRRSSRSSLSIGRSEERVGSDAAAASATAVRSGTGADRTDAESSFTDKTIFGSVTGTLIYARQEPVA